MTETFILQFIPKKISALGYEKYHIRYRDITIKKRDKVFLSAHNDLYFIVEDPQGILIESEYGMYDGTGNFIKDNAHIHKGEIIISNPNEENKRVKFIQVIIVS